MHIFDINESQIRFLIATTLTLLVTSQEIPPLIDPPPPPPFTLCDSSFSECSVTSKELTR